VKSKLKEASEMKAETYEKVGRWVVGFVLLSGLVYSMVILSTESAYASGCNCPTQAQYDAQATCAGRGGVQNVWCPVFNNPNEYEFRCGSGVLFGGTCAP
jgi:hypothetical protein